MTGPGQGHASPRVARRGPRVSVVAATYNHCDIVRETVESVLAQTIGDLELIVVDDGSTDGTADAIANIADPRVRLIRNRHSGFPAVTLNAAAARAQSDLLGMIGGDDRWTPRMLEQQLAHFERFPDVGIVHTAALHLVGSELVPQPPRCPAKPRMNPAEVVDRLLVRNFIYAPSVVLRRSLFVRLGGFDPELPVAEDYDLWLRLAEAGISFGYIAEPLLHYRIRVNSLSQNVVRDSVSTLRAIDKATQRSPGVYASRQKAVKRRRAILFRKLGTERLRRGDRAGVADLRRALSLEGQRLKCVASLCLGLARYYLVSRGMNRVLKPRRHGV